MYFPESESKNGWKSIQNKKNTNLGKLDIEIKMELTSNDGDLSHTIKEKIDIN